MYKNTMDCESEKASMSLFPHSGKAGPCWPCLLCFYPRVQQGGSTGSCEVLLISGDRHKQNSELCGYYFLWVELSPQKIC